jgi:hypothetical protein
MLAKAHLITAAFVSYSYFNQRGRDKVLRCAQYDSLENYKNGRFRRYYQY